MVYDGPRKFDDIVPFRLDAAGDSDLANNSS